MTPLHHKPTPSTNATLLLEGGVKSNNRIQKNKPSTLHVETEVNLYQSQNLIFPNTPQGLSSNDDRD